MMNIQKFYKALSVEDALKVYKETDGAAVLGGCGYLRMSTKQITTGIDLSGLGLDKIEKTAHGIEIGAMASLRQLELCPYFGGLFAQACGGIVGVQLRNDVSVGGTVAGRYPFSDVLTALSVLDVTVILAGEGEVSYWDFINAKPSKDILTKIIIKDNLEKAAFNSVRNSATDYAVINCAVSKSINGFAVAVGARPKGAVRVKEAEDFLAKEGLNPDSALKAGKICADRLEFGDNLRGSAEYRKAVCPAIVKNALLEVM